MRGYNVPGTDQYRHLDAVIAYLRRFDDRALDEWFIESLAEALDVGVIPVPEDPLDQANALADRWVTSVWLAGRDKSLRSVACRRAMRKLQELADVMEEWLADAEG